MHRRASLSFRRCPVWRTTSQEASEEASQEGTEEGMEKGGGRVETEETVEKEKEDVV